MLEMFYFIIEWIRSVLNLEQKQKSQKMKLFIKRLIWKENLLIQTHSLHIMALFSKTFLITLLILFCFEIAGVGHALSCPILWTSMSEAWSSGPSNERYWKYRTYITACPSHMSYGSRILQYYCDLCYPSRFQFRAAVLFSGVTSGVTTLRKL